MDARHTIGAAVTALALASWIRSTGSVVTAAPAGRAVCCHTGVLCGHQDPPVPCCGPTTRAISGQQHH
jgi:hypothetical protein